MYYLQSRYYDPTVGRFINADGYVSTGQGLLGYNMFAYCLNSPVNGCDPCGICFHRWDFWNDCEECTLKKRDKAVQNMVKFIKIAPYIRSVLEIADAFVNNIDVYAGIGLGMQGDVNLYDQTNVSAGVAYDVAGIRINDGEISFKQRCYNGADLSIFLPIIDASDEGYRNPFSDSYEWVDDQSPSDIPLYSIGAYFIAGGTFRISFDLNSFLDELNRAHDN